MLITGEENIKRYSLFVLKSALELEVKTGMKVARGQTAYARIKNEFNLKGNIMEYNDFIIFITIIKFTKKRLEAKFAKNIR